MKVQTSSRLSAINGELIRGKRVQAIYENLPDMAQETFLKGLDNLTKIRQPGDKITLQCKSVSTKKGELSTCEVSLTKDSEKV
jgi:hypothetical protein